MEGVIILAHGSRRKETEKILDSLIAKVKTKTGLEEILPVFLQFSEQNLEKAVEEFVVKGVKNIKIVPLFLFDGAHVTRDIPQKVEEIAEQYPELKVKMTKPLGDDPRIAEIIIDRLNTL